VRSFVFDAARGAQTKVTMATTKRCEYGASVLDLFDDRSAMQVGCRLSFSSFRCTVLYIGPVDGTQGIWWGVEWDDATRGKHSGTTPGGREYFKTRQVQFGEGHAWGLTS